MTVRSALARGRRLAEARMVDTCEITRPGVPVLNPDTDTYTDDFSIVYDGPCRMKTVTQASQVEAGEVAVEVRRYEVHLPLSTEDAVKRGDVVKFTSSTDAWLLDRKLVVIDVGLGSQVTARRLVVEDRT